VTRAALLPVLALSIPLLAVGSARAQERSSVPERVTWRLVDFVVLGDSAHGVQVILSPTLETLQGQNDTADIYVTLEPLAARRWIYTAMHVVDSVSGLRRDGRRPFALTPLIGNGGRTIVLVGLDGHEPRAEPFRLAIADTAARGRGFVITASASEIRQLFTIIDAVAQTSAVNSTTTSSYVTSQLDERPRVGLAQQLHYPDLAQNQRREGRVLAEFVIDRTGVADSTSYRALLSDGEEFSAAAREAILRTTYIPGRIANRPVNTLVWQWVKFGVLRQGS
jgi:hypothetical protein